MLIGVRTTSLKCSGALPRRVCFGVCRPPESRPGPSLPAAISFCFEYVLLVCRVNVVGTLSLIDLCHQRGIHITNFGTGASLRQCALRIPGLRLVVLVTHCDCLGAIPSCT
jgi:hypothetical protein